MIVLYLKRKYVYLLKNVKHFLGHNRIAAFQSLLAVVNFYVWNFLDEFTYFWGRYAMVLHKVYVAVVLYGTYYTFLD